MNTVKVVCVCVCVCVGGGGVWTRTLPPEIPVDTTHLGQGPHAQLSVVSGKEKQQISEEYSYM